MFGKLRLFFSKLSWDWLAVASLALWPLLYYWPVTLGQQVFSEGDINWLFLPIRTELSRALAEGRLPLWTPALQAGYPLFAEGEVAALYPLNLLLAWLLPAASAISYSILFNWVFASVGMYILVRSSGLRVPSAWLAGLVFGFNGFMVAHASHVPHLTVAAWLPWLLLFQQKYWQAKLISQPTSGWFLLICFSIAFQLLGGFPQMAFLNIMTYITIGILWPFLRNCSTKTKRLLWIREIVSQLIQSTIATLLPLVIGIGLAMVQLLPTFELIGFSNRGQELSKTFFTSYSMPPSALMQFISPFSPMGMPDASNMEYWAYLGILPIMLALLAPILSHNLRTRLFVLFAFCALLLALGDSTPIYEWLYYVPIFNRFRVPARFLFLFTFAFVFLAAIGFEEIQKRLDDDRRARVKPVFFASLGTSVLIVIIYLVYNNSIDYWIDAWKILPVLFVLSSVILVLAGIFRLIPRTLWFELVCIVIVIDLAAFASPFLSSLTRMSLPSDLMQSSRTVAAMDTQQSIYRVVVDKAPMTLASIRATLYANLSILYDKQAVKVYLPSLGLQRNENYIGQMTSKMRDLMNIRYYLLPLETVGSFSSALDETEPLNGLSLDLLSKGLNVPPLSLTQIELTSYTDQTAKLPDGFMAGRVTLGTRDGSTITFPIRLGVETADWAYDALTSEQIQHRKPATAISFPAYLKSIGRAFDGSKYVARYELTQNSKPLTITSVHVQSFLPGTGLTIDRIRLVDEAGHATSLASLLNQMDLSLAFRSHTAAMWENLSMIPRAFMVHSAQVVNGEQVLTSLKSPDFNPTRIVLLSDVAPADLVPVNTSTSSNDAVSITEYHAEHVTVNVQTQEPGYLVLTDTWYPGWVAIVDGTLTPVYRADYIFRAVPLPSGSHSVTFEYRPASFILGAAISLGSLVLCLGIVVVGKRNRK
ncbi:MAG: YfhO family protein [Chloroflexi bacterium]|nr:YfhO family protein [Chloroflexota bacterium]